MDRPEMLYLYLSTRSGKTVRFFLEDVGENKAKISHISIRDNDEIESDDPKEGYSVREASNIMAEMMSK